MKTHPKTQPARKKELLLADLIGDKKAHQLIESVRTYEGWKSCMQLDGADNSLGMLDALEINNAYKRFSNAPHLQAELQLDKILQLKRLVGTWIFTHTFKKKNLSQQPLLQTMLALQEHLARRQHQLEEHLDKKRQELERERKLKLVRLSLELFLDEYVEPGKRH